MKKRINIDSYGIVRSIQIKDKSIIYNILTKEISKSMHGIKKSSYVVTMTHHDAKEITKHLGLEESCEEIVKELISE